MEMNYRDQIELTEFSRKLLVEIKWTRQILALIMFTMIVDLII